MQRTLTAIYRGEETTYAVLVLPSETGHTCRAIHNNYTVIGAPSDECSQRIEQVQ